MKIFVAGGKGAIGRPQTAKLLAKGHAVVALIRSPLEWIVDTAVTHAAATPTRASGK